MLCRLPLRLYSFFQVSYDPAFVPAGCTSSQSYPGVTFGVSLISFLVFLRMLSCFVGQAGVTQGMLYDFADTNNLTLFGGVEPTVAAGGGYLQVCFLIDSLFSEADPLRTQGGGHGYERLAFCFHSRFTSLKGLSGSFPMRSVWQSTVWCVSMWLRCLNF